MRDANVSISTDEVLSLFNALPHISIQDKYVFKQTLQTTLIKDYTDICVFERCFEKFFEGRTLNINEEMYDPEILKTIASFTDGDILAIEKSIEEFIEYLSENASLEKIPDDILKLYLDNIDNLSIPGGLAMIISNSRQALFSSLNDRGMDKNDEDNDDTGINNILQEMINRAISKKQIGRQISNHEDYLLNKYIYQLTNNEIKEMKELIKRFGQKFKNRVSLRKKKIKHGGIDIKRTIRTSLQYGGIPFKILYKDRKIDRPQLVVLCDVSSSVNQYSRFMLLLTHTLQGLFSKVRAFAFISNIVEITDLFMEMDPERAINSIFTDSNFSYGWGSNYGKCLNEFIQDYSDSLTHKTTVLVLGDARNNYQDPGLNSLIKIKEKSRNLFWLNPEKKQLWDWGDSIASLYLSHCREMKEVNNFLDLSEFIDKLFIDR